jgi:hypothetical protein
MSVKNIFTQAMAVGPVIGYVHQYHIIRKSKSVGTFSIDICGILLFANILRLNFYVFQKYQLALLFQSIIMIFAQVFLLTFRFFSFISVPSMDLKIPKTNHNLLNPVFKRSKLRIWIVFGDGTFFQHIVTIFLSSSLYTLLYIHNF